MAALDSPDFAEAREYVRQELAAMGGRALPENELDTYTREFLRLVKEREVTSTPDTTSSTSSSRPHTTSSSTSRSAVYKSFPAAAGDKENRHDRIDLPASPAAHYHSFTADDSDWSTYTSTSDRKMKRKVFKCTAASTVPEEQQLPSIKSFIPPAQSQPHTRGLRRSDPVSRYHEYREMWERQQPPGVSNRNGLRWQIREHLVQQQQQQQPPPVAPLPQPNSYIVPSNKKRQRLRWDIRTRLAQQTL